MAGRLPVKDAVSAGGVAWRRDAAGQVEVVICGRRDSGAWGLPKGTPNGPGETIADTAVREVEEETGLRVRRGEELGAIEYWFVADGYRWHKFVHHWLMEPIGGDVSAHDAEHDDVEWASIERAMAVLSYPNEKLILARAAEALGAAG